MATVRTFLDAGVLLTAFRGEGEDARRALTLIEDTEREFVASDLLRLEVIPQAVFHKRREEVEFYETCFGRVTIWVAVNAQLVGRAQHEASRFGLHAMDALHVAAAKIADARDFVTTERATKPIYRVTGLRVISLYTLP